MRQMARSIPHPTCVGSLRGRGHLGGTDATSVTLMAKNKCLWNVARGALQVIRGHSQMTVRIQSAGEDGGVGNVPTAQSNVTITPRLYINIQIGSKSKRTIVLKQHQSINQAA